MITLQHFIFPKPGVCTMEPLYFRRNDKAFYDWTADVIHFDRDGIAEFDTYFNGISAEKFFKYTKIKQIFIKLKLKGVFRVTLMRKEKLGDNIIVEFIDETVISTDGQTKDIVLPFNTQKTAGMFCVKLLGLNNGFKFYGGEYVADVSEDEIRPIKIGIDICTFKREKFIEKNLENLHKAFFNDSESSLYNNLEVFVSDNAKTLPEDLNCDHIHIFRNKNVGGAGGFTRGLIEIIKNNNRHGITHALVMDDDIVLEPEVIFRTYALLSVLKDNYRDAFLGGAMLRLDKQNIQVESGAVWNKGNIVSLKSGLDLNSLDACLYNELEESVDYNAWWYSVIPIENVRIDNLPLPIFIRGDDVEYGLRNTKKLILMNGICVWHEPFENKYVSSMYYYIFRNRLIDNAVREINLPEKQLIREFKEHVFNELFCLRYKNAELLIRGLEDFFKGIDWLKAQDGEILHKEIMAAGYQMRYVEELDFMFSYPQYERGKHIPQDIGLKGFIKKIIIGLTFHGLFIPANKEIIVPTIGVQPRQLIRVRRSLNYDLGSKKGFVTEKNVKEALRIYRAFRKVVRKIKSNYRKNSQQYCDRKSEITSLEFWQNYLGI